MSNELPVALASSMALEDGADSDDFDAIDGGSSFLGGSSPLHESSASGAHAPAALDSASHAEIAAGSDDEASEGNRIFADGALRFSPAEAVPVPAAAVDAVEAAVPRR